MELSAKWRNFRRRWNLFSVIICEKYGVTILSLLEKYIPFSGFCTIPWKVRYPIWVFISVGFVSIQLLARDRGFKLGFAAKKWLAYIFDCSANNCHLSSSINFWKHFRTLISSSKSTFTPLTPRNANLGRATPWGTKGCEKSDTSSYDALSFTTLPVSESPSESSSLVSNQKSSDSSENTSLSSSISKT